MSFRSMQVRPGCFVYVTLECVSGEILHQEWYITRGRSHPAEGVYSPRSRYGKAVLGLSPKETRMLDGKDGFRLVRVDMVWQSPAVMLLWAESRMRDFDTEHYGDRWNEEPGA